MGAVTVLNPIGLPWQAVARRARANREGGYLFFGSIFPAKVCVTIFPPLTTNVSVPTP
jgi:hypothetical protein